MLPSIQTLANNAWKLHILANNKHTTTAKLIGEQLRYAFLRDLKLINESDNYSASIKDMVNTLKQFANMVRQCDGDNAIMKALEESQISVTNQIYHGLWDSHEIVHKIEPLFCSIIPAIISFESKVWTKCFGKYRLQVLIKNLSDNLIGRYIQEFSMFFSKSLRENKNPIGAQVFDRISQVKEGRSILSKILEFFVAETGNTLNEALMAYFDSLSKYPGVFEVLLWISIQYKCYYHFSFWFDKKEETFWKTAITNQLQLRISEAEDLLIEKKEPLNFPSALAACIDGLLATRSNPSLICREILERILQFGEGETSKVLLQCNSVLKLLSSKEQFEISHLEYLSDRMIKSTSNIEFEKFLIREFFNSDVSTSFIYFAQSIINDKANQFPMEKKMNTYFNEKRIKKSYPLLKVLIGASERWPLKKISTDLLNDSDVWNLQKFQFSDNEIQEQIELINEFYKQAFPKRILFWDHLNSMVLMSSKHLDKSYEFIVNGAQAAVLLLFNGEVSEHSFASMCGLLKMPGKLLSLVLASLVAAKLLLSSLPVDQMKDSIYSLNFSYKS
jgi:hypothetical protein